MYSERKMKQRKLKKQIDIFKVKLDEIVCLNVKLGKRYAVREK